MAASSVSIVSRLCPWECSQWERTYWEKGPQAAESYCAKKVEDLIQIQTALNQASRLILESSTTHEEVAKTISELIAKTITIYQVKQQRYERDWASLIPSSKACQIHIQGRGEPGRHPFSFPSFRRRYTTFEDLQAYLNKKAELHGSLSNSLQAFQVYLPSGHSVQAAVLKTLALDHEDRFKKWQGRKMDLGKFLRLQEQQRFQTPRIQQLQEKFRGWLIPEKTNPIFSSMGFDEVHRQGHVGKGSTISVFERGCDTSHSLLRDSVVDLAGGSDPEDVLHGTFVSGIICQVAPETRIEIFNHVSNLKRKIINFSAWVPDPFSILLSQPQLLEDHVTSRYSEGSSPVKRLRACSSLESPVKKTRLREIGLDNNKKSYVALLGDLTGKLLIQAIGNQGVVLDQNEVVAQGFQGVLTSDENKKRTIFVVNLQPNALYPERSSNLPGKSLAEMTISAIGTDISSSVPGNRYEKNVGTSFATPFVSGAASLIEANFPKLSAEQIRTCLLKSVTPIVLDAKGRPRLVTFPDRLQNYSQESREAGQAIYGRGLLNANFAFLQAKIMHFQQRLSQDGQNENFLPV